MSISKLAPNATYKIISYKQINTQYGVSYILKDEDFNEYFSNKKINEYISKNRPKKEFFIKTSDYKTFSKDGKQISFIDVLCY